MGAEKEIASSIRQTRAEGVSSRVNRFPTASIDCLRKWRLARWRTLSGKNRPRLRMVDRFIFQWDQQRAASHRSHRAVDRTILRDHARRGKSLRVFDGPRAPALAFRRICQAQNVGGEAGFVVEADRKSVV